MILVFLAWASTFELISEVKTIAYVVSETKKQIVSHKEGGVITASLVHEGDTVSAGQTLMIIGNLHIKEKKEKLEENIDQLKARMHRLQSVIHDKPYVYDGSYSRAKYIEEKEALEMSLDTHRKKIEVLQKQIEAQVFLVQHLSTEKKTILEEVKLLENKLTIAKDLAARGAGSESAVLNSKVDSIRVQSRLNNIIEELDHAENLQIELKSKINYEESIYLKDVHEKLNEARLDLKENLTELSTVSTRMTRQKVVSPIVGTIHEIQMDTIGSAIRPNQELLAIIPEDELFVIEARLDLKDRDLVWLGMNARITPPGNSIYAMKPLVGKVSQISADTFYDQKTQYAYFKVMIATDSKKQHSETSLHQGMQVDVRLDTGSHRVIEYIARPLMKGLKDVMREPLI